MFRVIQGSLEQRLAKEERRRNIETGAFLKTISEHSKDNRPVELLSDFERMKVAHAIIVFTARLDSELRSKEYENVLFFGDVVDKLLCGVSSAEFMRWFPPKKIYDGGKYGCKDYFSTMETVRKYPTITDPGEFLAGYYNLIIHAYKVNTFMAMDVYFRNSGQETPLEEFLRELGVTQYRKTELTNGKILITGSDGSQQIVKKTLPRHLRVITGRKRK